MQIHGYFVPAPLATAMVERSIRTAELSLRMEGFSVTDACKELCRKLLAGEITLQEYLTQVISGEGKA